MSGANLTLYSTTPANNATIGSISWAEGMLPSVVNDSARLVLTDLRSFLNVLAGGWVEYGDGDSGYTATYISGTSFKFTGVDLTAIYHVGRRIRLVAASPGTIFGTIATSAYVSDTTLTITWDSGTLSSEAITSVMVSPVTVTNRNAPAIVAAQLPSGTLSQIVQTETGAVATGTTVMPFDDTIPTSSEGDQFMSLAITPKSATSTLVIIITAALANNVATTSISGALFQDATAAALAAGWIYTADASAGGILVFTHKMTSGTASATTFKFRAGASSASTTTFNGSAAARLFGGVMASSIVILEIAP